MKPSTATIRIARKITRTRSVFISHLPSRRLGRASGADHATGRAGREAVMVAREGVKGGDRGDLAVVLSGGGARAAYQVGVLRGLARHMPETRFSIVIGVSAGAINAAFVASHPGNLHEAMEEFAGIWGGLRVEDIFRLDTRSLAQKVLIWLRWATRLTTGEPLLGPEIRG